VASRRDVKLSVQLHPAASKNPLCVETLRRETVLARPTGRYTIQEIVGVTFGVRMAARATHRLSAPGVRALTKPGRHADGKGLYLVVDPNGSKRWVYLFRWEGKPKEMGLGGLGAISLARAREKAQEAREALDEGKNPIDTRRAIKAIPTFGELADEVVETKAAGFRGAKSRAIWDRTFNVYAVELRTIRIDHVDTAAILKVLKPIWAAKAETGNKARRCIEAVLDTAKAKKLRSGENPAAWRGQLAHLLPKRQKLTHGHLRAMPYPDVPAFVARLGGIDAITARAMEFLILTAARSSEVIGATWGEIDFENALWTIPAARMKQGREHRVPLSAAAVAVLERAGEGSNRAPEDYLFPGPRKRGSVDDRSLSSNALRALLIRMEIDATAHGFRSSFRDWAGELTTFPREVAEAALAHRVGDETERAYRRGDALEKRRKLMDAWASYLAHGVATSAVVTPLRLPIVIAAAPDCVKS
jgi:integrase